MELKQLGKEYKKSLKQLNRRIHKLQGELKKLESVKESENAHIQERVTRLKPLLIMQRDLRELSNEIANYYELGWWRSERYTFNTRKSRLPTFYYGYIVEDADEYE